MILLIHPGTILSRCVGVTAARSIGASMDRLLRYFLGQFIRRGTMTFTAASGTRFTCGDGTGRPVSARFLTERTSAGSSSIPTGARRSLYGRHVRGRERLDCGRAGDPARSARNGAALGQAAMVAALFEPARQAIQLAQPGEDNVAHHYDLDGRLYSLFLDADRHTVAPISNRRRRASTTPSSPRNAMSRPS